MNQGARRVLRPAPRPFGAKTGKASVLFKIAPGDLVNHSDKVHGCTTVTSLWTNKSNHLSINFYMC